MDLIGRHIPACDYVFVTHTHYDHVMDVPALAHGLTACTGATAYLPPNGHALLRAHGVPACQIRVISAGEKLALGAFEVETSAAEHVQLPGAKAGPLSQELAPPPRLRDYRMDICLTLRSDRGAQP